MHIVVDTFAGDHEMTLDCEVCCRPLLVNVHTDPYDSGGEPTVDVSPG